MVTTRVVLDQALILPLNMTVFLSWPAMLTQGPTDAGLAEAVRNVRESFWPAASFGWSIWPWVHMLNFRYVPLNHRLGVLNVISLCVWSYATFCRDEPELIRRASSEQAPQHRANSSGVPSTCGSRV